MKEKFLKVWKETLLLGIILLLVVIGIRWCVYQTLLTQNYDTFFDTQSYSYLEEYHFGKMDSFRTPIYPIFIRAIGLFGDASIEQLYTNVATAQEWISLVSVFVFYLTLKKITKNKRIQSTATLIYGCLPSIFSYNLCILTESLSISLMVVFFYTLVCYLQNKKIYQSILLALQMLVLILLRPSFLYLFIFFAIFWILSFLLEKENRKKIGIGILATGMVGVCILGYSIANEKINGVTGLSNVTGLNQADIMIGMQLYGSYENNPMDDEITKIIEEYPEKEEPWYQSKNEIVSQYGYQELNRYVKSCIKHNPKQFLVGTVRKILEIGREGVHTIITPTRQNEKRANDLRTICQNILPISFAFCYGMILLELSVFFWNRWKKAEWTKKEQIRFYAMILMAGLIFVTLLGAQAEYQRLIAPILSFIIILCACYLERILRKQED